MSDTEYVCQRAWRARVMPSSAIRATKSPSDCTVRATGGILQDHSLQSGGIISYRFKYKRGIHSFNAVNNGTSPGERRLKGRRRLCNRNVLLRSGEKLCMYNC